ncbi:MAG: hypothetical protein ACTSRK_16505 [Promethearchaeota archaeon]
MTAQILSPPSSQFSREEYFEGAQDQNPFPLPANIINLKNRFPMEQMLQPAVKTTHFFHVATFWPLKFQDYTNFSILSTPPEMKRLLKPLVKKINRKEIFRRKRSSHCDCYLGFLARIYDMEVISYDTDVYRSLNNILQFQACWPFDVVRQNTSGTYILDTNVIIYLMEKHSTHFTEIISLFKKIGIQLIIPDFVLGEYWNYKKKKEKKYRKKRRNRIKD